MRRNSWTVWALVLAALATLGACGQGQSGQPVGAPDTVTSGPSEAQDDPSEAEEQEVIPVSIGMGGFSITPTAILVADSQGFFDEEGIDAELFETGGGANSFAAALSGSATASAIVTADAVGAYREQGVQTVPFALLMGQESGGLLMSTAFAEEHGLTEDTPMAEKAEALVGARLATQGLGSAQHARWEIFMRDYAGVDANTDAQMVVIAGGVAAQVAALTTGQVDALSAGAPETNQLVADGEAVWIANMLTGDIEAFNGLPFFSLATNVGNIQNQPEVYQRITNAIAKAQQFIHENPEEARDVLHEDWFSETDPEVWADVWEDVRQAIPETPVITDEALSVLYSIYFDEDQVGEDAGELFNNSFAEEAIEQLENSE